MTDDGKLLASLLGTADERLEGAASQTAQEDPDMDGLPRILRYAVMASSDQRSARGRLVAEILELAPELHDDARSWMLTIALEQTIALSARLDRLSVEQDKPALWSLADCVRVIALPVPKAGHVGTSDYMRVARALAMAREDLGDVSDETEAKVDRVVLGWASAPLMHGGSKLSELPAISIGTHLVDNVTHSIAQVALARSQAAGTKPIAPPVENPLEGIDDLPGHVVICRRVIDGPMTARQNEALRPYIGVVNTAVPLIACPDRRQVRHALLAEYPYAKETIDFCLAGLVGQSYIRFEPILLIGGPGCGKTRFVRRWSELLGVGLWRIDATQADGSAIGGTDKRWSTASPCAPFLAVSRHQHANPLVLVDELEKAATRTDYGNLWNSLTSLCEHENARRYPDPCLGAEMDVSWVSYIATANTTTGLPGPLLDRFRSVNFPSPREVDIDVLAETFRLDAARERGLDPAFITPLTAPERDVILRQWGGGSARRLRRFLDVVWRAREKASIRH